MNFYESDFVAVEASERTHCWNVNIFECDSGQHLTITTTTNLEEANRIAHDLDRVFRTWTISSQQATNKP